MRRRDFVAATITGAGIAASPRLLRAAMAVEEDRAYVEWREYRSVSGKRMRILEDFVSGAMLPALKRMNVGPVGAFRTVYGPDLATLTLFIAHKTLDSATTTTARLLDDGDVSKAGADYFAAPIDNPPFVRMNTRLLRCIASMPQLVLPEGAGTNKPRIVEVRTYQSHNERVGRNKIEQINAGEVEYFRRSGAPAVFFAETIYGDGMPSLSYMLAFPDMAARDAGWAAFRKDPDWLKLAAMPQYQDNVSSVSDIILRPTAYSQL